MTYPQFSLNLWAMVVAALAAFVLGGLWYGPLFGRAWLRAMGWREDMAPPSPREMRRSMLIQLVGVILVVYVITHSLLVWFPSSWGMEDVGSRTAYGFMCSFFTWIGFYVPLQMNKVAWEKRPWRLFFINTGHDFVTLSVVCQILAHWR